MPFVNRKLVHRQLPGLVTACLQRCHMLFQRTFHDLQMQIANGFPMDPSQFLDRPDGYFGPEHRLNPSCCSLRHFRPRMLQWYFFSELFSALPALVTVAYKSKFLRYSVPDRHIFHRYTPIAIYIHFPTAVRAVDILCFLLTLKQQN